MRLMDAGLQKYAWTDGARATEDGGVTRELAEETGLRSSRSAFPRTTGGTGAAPDAERVGTPAAPVILAEAGSTPIATAAAAFAFPWAGATTPWRPARRRFGRSEMFDRIEQITSAVPLP